MLRRKGFTLVEILFVLIIAAGIVMFAVPAYKRSKVRARYEAATGILMSAGNAYNNLKQDFENNSHSCAFPLHTYELPAQNESGMHAGMDETAEDFICGASSASERETRVMSVLYDKKYLDPFVNRSEYRYYVMQTGSMPTTICRGKCSGVVCMCLPDDKASDPDYACFYGASFSSDGRVRRIVSNSCPNS